MMRAFARAHKTDTALIRRLVSQSRPDILLMISVTTEDDGGVVDLIMDEEGLAGLERILGWLRDGLDSQYHLMSAEWAFRC